MYVAKLDTRFFIICYEFNDPETIRMKVKTLEYSIRLYAQQFAP